MMNNNSWIIIADGIVSGALPLMARNMGGQVTAVVAGDEACMKAAAALDVDRVIWCPIDETTPAEAWAQAVAKAAVKEEPRVILAANLPMARILLGSAAVSMKAAVTSGVTSVALEEEKVIVTHTVADGRAVQELETKGCAAGIIMEGGEEAAPAKKMAEIEIVARENFESELQIVKTSVETGGADLANADRVVGVGVGIGSKDNIQIARKLAAAFHAEVACSLPLCDNYRWFDHSYVVGSSTQKISPRIYMMVGISGQPQHMTGVRGAKTVVAINNDPDAPILKKCNYGILGDLNKIVPVLTDRLKEM